MTDKKKALLIVTDPSILAKDESMTKVIDQVIMEGNTQLLALR